MTDTRTAAEARADLTRRRNLRLLGEAAGSLEYQASISENGGSVVNAHAFKDRAHAIRRAMLLNARVTELEGALREMIGAFDEMDDGFGDVEARDRSANILAGTAPVAEGATP